MEWGRKKDPQNVEMEPAEKAPIYNPKRANPSKELAQVRRIEDRILLDALRTIEGVGRGADYDDAEERGSVTADEIAEFGSIEAAIRSKRIALDARRSEKDAPVYLKHQHNIAVAIMKARATEQAAKSPHTAIQVNVFMGDKRDENVIDANYQELELDEGEEE